jgi:general secretion pathway protein G
LLFLAAPALAGQVDFREVTITRHTMGGVVAALRKYRQACDAYPLSLEPLTKSFECGRLHSEALLKKIGKDAWGRDLNYSSDGKSFRLVSYGRDGKAGGEGIDADVVVSR